MIYEVFRNFTNSFLLITLSLTLSLSLALSLRVLDTLTIPYMKLKSFSIYIIFLLPKIS